MASAGEVKRKVDAMWADPHERSRVLTELEKFGTEAYEREAERVRLAILKLCEARTECLIELVAVAKRDYRDVLMWAEYPAEGQALWAVRPNLSSEERQRLEGLRRRDRQQYQDWLRQ